MKLEEILVIKNGNESYGISTADINQISRVPMLMELPLRPNCVRGLCAVSGTITTMLDMNLLLDMEEVDFDNEKSRLLTLNDELSHSSLLVSEIYNTIEVKERYIEYVDNEDDSVVAIYKYKDSLIQVVSLETLFNKVNKVEIESKEVYNGKVKDTSVVEEETNRFLIFAMQNEKYALHIDYLTEIILADISYTDVAGSSDEVMGLITLRDELLVVLDLRIYYGFKPKYDAKNRILVASLGGKKIGLLVDEILDIKNFVSKDIESMHEEFKDNKISGVIHDEDTLISYFNADVLEQIFRENESFIDDKGDDDTSGGDDETAFEVIVFKLADKEYAFRVESVAEIIDMISATDVAYTDDNIDGIINMRGQIITIVSLCNKLNLAHKANEDSKIIICEIDDTKIGFVVDSVSDILEIKNDEIREQEDGMFDNVFHLDDGERLVLSMDLESILENGE